MQGPYPVSRPLILAPMAGVSNAPFRQLCRELGADCTVTEMVKTSNTNRIQNNHRCEFLDEEGPHIIQIIGNNPEKMAMAASQCAALGADIVDINMGCPAKKFEKKPAGSALLADPGLVKEILEAVVGAIDIPVTLKIRTGIDHQHINAMDIGQIAQESGIQALVVHGRTRDQGFSGKAEHRTTAELVGALDIPVIANGDIDSVEAAQSVLAATGAAGLMIGRGARRNPFLFQQIAHFLNTGQKLAKPELSDLQHFARHQLQRIYRHDQHRAPTTAARQLGWLFSGYEGVAKMRQALANCHDETSQWNLIKAFVAHPQ